MIYSSSNLKTPSKLCSGSKSHDVQEVLKKKQVTVLILPLLKRKGFTEFLSDYVNTFVAVVMEFHHVCLAAAGCKCTLELKANKQRNVLQLPFSGYIKHKERLFSVQK